MSAVAPDKQGSESVRICLTGGAGYIGSHTCLELLNANFNVLVYDNLKGGSFEAVKRVESISGKSLKFIHSDLLNYLDLKEVMIKFEPDIVLHFAGLKSVSDSIKDPLSYYTNNVIGSINLLNAMSCSSSNEMS